MGNFPKIRVVMRFMVKIPLPLLHFTDRCQVLTAVFHFALSPLYYADSVPFFELSCVVGCIISAVL